MVSTFHGPLRHTHVYKSASDTDKWLSTIEFRYKSLQQWPSILVSESIIWGLSKSRAQLILAAMVPQCGVATSVSVFRVSKKLSNALTVKHHVFGNAFDLHLVVFKLELPYPGLVYYYNPSYWGVTGGDCDLRSPQTKSQ
jgi:hypothetical protein